MIVSVLVRYCILVLKFWFVWGVVLSWFGLVGYLRFLLFGLCL